MGNRVYRIYTEKRPEYDNEAKSTLHDLESILRIPGIKNLRIFHRYDIEGILEETYLKARSTIFAEPPLDFIYDETLPFLGIKDKNSRFFAWEYLPGQYDQRADSAAQALQILAQGEKPLVKYATLFLLKGNISDAGLKKTKDYIINPVDSREAKIDKPDKLNEQQTEPEDVPVIEGFIGMKEAGLKELSSSLGLAMDMEDLFFLQSHFKNEEKRDPTLTEVRIIDTYWSDHCRHTTFLTEIGSVQFEDGPYKSVLENAYENYLETRKSVYKHKTANTLCLMDMATIAMKKLKAAGYLGDLDESDEINACSIIVPVDIEGKKEEWLVMFKNETHNHPTEIEPFGGAATCIGGAIRDPLSGRSYVYQAMRVTGSGDPRKPVKDTLPGKLPQRKITIEAAHGYSSYGNQIGLATGHVAEIYDEGYIAKRMEIGAVIGAAPRQNVRRSHPEKGDKVILVGGRTGRDGCGGATGSSKSHTEESIAKAGAEVQKGNAPEERKIQRLFRDPDTARLIKKCNDFGAGGVSVAIGELADGLIINLDAIPKKYDGLDGTELAISESQERMAVLLDALDASSFIESAAEENLEATVVAEVTDEKRVKMNWRGKTIVDIDRDFLNSNGAKKHTHIKTLSPTEHHSPFINIKSELMKKPILEAWKFNLSQPNAASQKGLVERFDGSIGAGSVTMPFGGRTQLTPAQSMAAKIPVPGFETSTGTVMSWGFDPEISRWSPYHGAIYSVIDSVSKAAAAGIDYRNIRLSMQEYFEKPYKIPERWGKPFTALLGAFTAQMELRIPAIGGKDSMSGSFNSLDVPPTLVSFAVAPADVSLIITPEFKKPGSPVYFLPLKTDGSFIPDWEYFHKLYSGLFELIKAGKISSIHTVRGSGIAEAISKMSFGNLIGFEFKTPVKREMLFGPGYGSFVIELKGNASEADLKGLDYKFLGNTIPEPEIRIENTAFSLSLIIKEWLAPFSEIFPHKTEDSKKALENYSFKTPGSLKRSKPAVKPLVLIPVFPGTNCEYDSARAFEKAGAQTNIFIFRNRNPSDIEISIREMAQAIQKAQIIMLPGGFSAGDEPEGSGKFIANVFRSGRIKDAVMELLKNRDGLMLGICNGFQALIKLGLVPYGEIRDLDENSPTLTYNTIGRHMSTMVRTKVVSRLSPWFYNSIIGEIHTLPVSHGEGRFIANDEVLEGLKKNGRIATQYVDDDGKPSPDMPYNPNGSIFAIEGITSPDGRVLGKMAHSERTGFHVAVNIPGNKFQRIFDAGVEYYK